MTVVAPACAPGRRWCRAGRARWRSSTSRATRRSTSCSTTPHDTAERYSAPDTIVAQGNVFLTTGSVLRSNLGDPLMTIVADDVGRHDTIGGACSQGVQHAALRPSHQAPARLRGELPRRGREVGAGQARPRLEHQLVHERAGRGGRHARHRRRHLRARPLAHPARRAGHARARLQLPADQQPLQRLRSRRRCGWSSTPPAQR